jgi:hypothetical protein
MIKSIVLLSLLVLVESIQLVIVLGLLSQFMPFGAVAFNADLFPVYKGDLKPNWQIQIYHIFIVASIIAQFITVYAFRRKLERIEFQMNIKRLLCVDTLWVFIQCFAVFKILINNSPAWAWQLFYLSLGASIVSRIFWIEVALGISKAEEFLKKHAVLSPRLKHSRVNSAEQSCFSATACLWTPLFIIVESVQVLIGFNWLAEHAKGGSGVLSYGVFIASVGLFSFLASIKKARFWQTRSLIIVETLITFLLLSALFKMVIYDYRNQLATNAYHVLLVLAVLNKIFWPLIENAGKTIDAFLTSQRNARTLRILGDCLMVGLIAAMIYLPDPEAVLAKIFVGEQFHHMNHFIMAPGWAYVSGCVLDVDVISRYGIGFPMVLSTLAKWMGGFSHLNILRVIMWVCIFYYVLSYLFLRVWLKSFTLAAAAILIGIKVQMFYTLTLPQPLTYASGTPVRFVCDIFFMFCIWGHLCTRRWIYLWLAAASCAAALFYMMETGLYLTAAFGGYLMMHALIPILRREVLGKFKGQMAAALCMLSVPFEVFLLLWLAVGKHVLTASFWHNTFEFSQYFTKGLFMGSWWGGLQYGQFWDLLIGFAFPILYILTILIVGTLCVLSKISKKHLMVVVLCFYGLGAHHYYIAMATTNNYYMRGLPFVFVCFYWIRLGVYRLPRDMRLRVGMAVMIFSAYALWTNHHYLSYPNMFNFSRNPMVDPLVAEELPDRKSYLFHKVWDIPENLKLPLNSLGQKDEGLRRDFATDDELKAYYHQENNFSDDTQLIQSLTGPQEPVALIGSYEIEMLMQSNRKPLFYYFSMTFSRPLRMRNFGAAEIFTHGQLKKLIGQLQGAPSPYVFMERIFLNRNVPAEYYHDNPGLMGLLDYVNNHYQPYRYGKFLVALKRI